MTTQPSVDTRVDTTLNLFFHWLGAQIPLIIVPFFMSVYAKSVDTCVRVYTQGARVLGAIQNSFQDQQVSFLKYGDVYVPFPHFANQDPILVSSDATWEYSVGRNEFKSYTATKHFTHMPYLGAALTYTTVSATETTEYSYDMTEWLSNQCVTSTDAFVPFQVIVGAWAHSVDVTLYSPDFSGYVLTVMNLEGDEISYDLATGAIIVEKVVEAETVEEVVSGPAVEEVVEEVVEAREADAVEEVVGPAVEEAVEAREEGELTPSVEKDKSA